MKIFSICKDGGPESNVTSFTIVEIKSLFSVMFLKFSRGTRENYHSHAFNAFTWFLSGSLIEHRIDGGKKSSWYKRSLRPKMTPRHNLHKVYAYKDSWCFSIRGPWSETWTEYNEKTGQTITLTNGRKIVSIS